MIISLKLSHCSVKNYLNINSINWLHSLPFQNDFLTHRVDTAHSLHVDNRKAFIFLSFVDEILQNYYEIKNSNIKHQVHSKYESIEMTS